MRTRLRDLTTLFATAVAAVAAVLVAPQVAQAATPCHLAVPANPTSAAGLATPYRLTGCDETNADQSAFVEATILDPATGQLSVYHPLVINAGQRPRVAPVKATLPANAVVGIWFGSNADTLDLVGQGARAGVTGFGQFSYINARAFFTAAHTAITAGTLKVPPLGTATDGKPCPTTRDFSVVDQDQSDNLLTSYWVTNGKVSQLPVGDNSTQLTNGSDEGLLAKFIDPALGCTAWKVPDLTAGGALTASLATNELQAGLQAAPMALVPTSDPMVSDGGTAKTNSYRVGVDQAALPAGQTPQEYCTLLASAGLPRIKANATLFATKPGPGGADLLSFLTNRYAATLMNLKCNPPQPPLPQGPRPVRIHHHF